MSVGLKHPQSLVKIKGIRLSASSAKIYRKKRDDIALIEITDGSVTSAAFTQNRFCAAPVQISKNHLSKSKPRYCLINAGNANAGTGEDGLSNSKAICRELAKITNCNENEILPFSTGVIGEDLPVEKINKVLPQLVKNLSEDCWVNVAKSIMTTDTIPKAVSSQISIANSTVSITGIAKGSGMIKPDMATMLSFVATDANVTKDALDKIRDHALFKSFNRITVDGDTSTNDSFLLISTCAIDAPIIDKKDSKEFKILENEIIKVCRELAQAIVRDGEGATKFISIQVDEGIDSSECLSVAYKVAESLLVKTAFTASDPNWGRIIAAIGNSNIRDLDIHKIDVYIDDICIVNNGERSKTYSEDKGKKVMRQNEIILRINLRRGTFSEEIWTTDLSYEYIKINAEYRS
jgi:glutamate N-acetyltransferase/amino-acid N-acetyltransferase|tara:strand:+ start:113 stop:1333 length:1221 start_codon:yes stop_codon:yes gene_type:complete